MSETNFHSQPMHRRERFNFDEFDKKLAEALGDITIEHTIGHAVKAGLFSAEEGLTYLEAYESTFNSPPEAA